MGASASGRGQLAVDSSRKLAGAVAHEGLATAPILQGFLVVPYWAMVRFGRWDEILEDKGPRHETAFTRAAYRYARAMALTARGRLDEAEESRSTEKALLEPA